MKNIRNISIALLGSIFALALLGNRNGRAASQGKGNTGAPGDELNANGTPQTCINCHGTGPITATMGITLLETDGDTVQTYQPGTNYILRVQVKGTGTTVEGYGFQMIGLNSNNVDIKGMSDFGGISSNNYKISNLNNGRSYAEQSNTSAVDTFNVRWKAPVAGTGPVTFYAAGNAVNGNNGTGGDGAATATLLINEAVPSDVQELVFGLRAMRAAPNLTNGATRLLFEMNEDGEVQLLVATSTGEVVRSQQRHCTTGSNEWALDMSHLPSGWYYLVLQGAQNKQSVKVFKF